MEEKLSSTVRRRDDFMHNLDSVHMQVKLLFVQPGGWGPLIYMEVTVSLFWEYLDVEFIIHYPILVPTGKM